jgi:hypothetical protein
LIYLVLCLDVLLCHGHLPPIAVSQKLGHKQGGSSFPSGNYTL